MDSRPALAATCPAMNLRHRRRLLPDRLFSLVHFHSWARIEKRVVHRDTDGERWNGRSRSQIAKVNKQLSIGTSPLPEPDVQDSARYIAILRI